MRDQRYRLTLASAGWPVQHGWWANEATARAKFTRWIGEYGSMPGALITLADEETGETLTT